MRRIIAYLPGLYERVAGLIHTLKLIKITAALRVKKIPPGFGRDQNFKCDYKI